MLEEVILLGQLDYETMLNSIPDGLFVIDNEHKIIFFNEIASHLTGWKAKDILGKRCYEVLQSSLCANNCPAKKAMLEKNQVHSSHVLIMTKKQKSIPVQLSATPLSDKHKSITGCLAIFSDQREMYPTYFGKFHELGLVGSSPLMKEVFQLIEIVAETDSNVLILGKTGTGKELIANAIHELSARKTKPFVKVNCAALSDTLLESELFGHERGAFTGAFEKRIGRFELANEGTIFLDEISEISPRFQAKLLRIIQEGEFEKVGSSKTQKTNVRIIVASNKDLQNLVKKNLFRDDLFYRLNVFPIYLPEIKERKEDLKALITHFLNEFNMKFDKPKSHISEEAFALLQTYEFPGNVRELRNIIEHAYIKARGNILEEEDLPDYLKDNSPNANLNQLVWEKEREHINKVLKQCHGNKSKAAKTLGISRKTLYNKLKSTTLE